MKNILRSVSILFILLLLRCGSMLAQQSSLAIPKLESILGIKGQQAGKEFKITIPQNDLHITVDGFAIIPPMGLGSWIVFTPAHQTVMIMGDLVLQGNEIGPVQQEVIRQGLTISALHNHFVRNTPAIMYMHISGMGTDTVMAIKVKAVLNRIATLRGGNPARGSSASVKNTLDTAMIHQIVGYAGEMSRGVYKITIGRPDVPLLEHGVKITSFAGFNTWAAWQGSPEKAAVAGDFAMLAAEVPAVIKALVENGIEVVAVHNHMVNETPRIFFLHYWGVGSAKQLAKGLRAALNQTGKHQPAGHQIPHHWTIHRYLLLPAVLLNQNAYPL